MKKKFILSLLLLVTICLLVFAAADLQTKAEFPPKDKVMQVKNELPFTSLAETTLMTWVALLYFRK